MSKDGDLLPLFLLPLCYLEKKGMRTFRIIWSLRNTEHVICHPRVTIVSGFPGYH